MLGVNSNNLIKIHVDNQVAISFANNPVYIQIPKHIDIKYHFIISHIQNNIIELACHKYIILCSETLVSNHCHISEISLPDLIIQFYF